MRTATLGFLLGAVLAVCVALSSLFPRDDFWIGAALGIVFPWTGAALGALIDKR